MIGILKGLATTFSTFTRKTVTIQYPEVKHPLPQRQRSFPVLTWDFDHDEPFCTGCNVCVRNCPVDCMTAVMMDNPKYKQGTSNRRKIVEKFWIDYARCMRCNICVEVCPFEAIVMDNTWGGHEHAAYDRRDLHMDIEDLLYPSKSGRLVDPFRPLDNIEANLALAEGKEPPEPGMKAARPEARLAQLERIAQGLPAAIQEREPEQPAVAAAAGPAGGEVDEEVAALSPRKLRAKRMKAERAAREAQEAGQEVPAEILNDLRRFGSQMYKELTGEEPARPGAPPAAAPAAGAPAAAAPAGDVGDPNSPRKIRARRMRAEREARALLDAGQTVPDDLLERLRETESEMYKQITGKDPGEAATAAPAASAGAAPAGQAGDPNSPRKLRARRMKAERAAREYVQRGEEIPADILATITELGGTIPTAEDV